MVYVWHMSDLLCGFGAIGAVLGIPTTAESCIEPHKIGGAVPPGGGVLILKAELIPLGVQDLLEIHKTLLVQVRGQFHRTARSIH